jgi:hypothetical protein
VARRVDIKRLIGVPDGVGAQAEEEQEDGQGEKDREVTVAERTGFSRLLPKPGARRSLPLAHC